MPWWVWAGIAVFGAALIFRVGSRLVPEDGDLVLAEALVASEKSDLPALLIQIERLKRVPGRELQVQFLEGVVFLGSSKPLKAIPLFKQAAEDKVVRVKALLSLGRAYGISGQLSKASEVLNSIVDDPNNGDMARLTIAGMLGTVQAFEPALAHLNVLAEKKYQLGKVLYQRGEILFDLGKVQEAQSDYAAAIDADRNDPENSLKAVRLLRSRAITGDFKDVDKYAELLDNPTAQNHLRAERLLADGKLKEAEAALDKAKRDSPANPQLSVTFGKVMLAYNTPEKARQALPEVFATCATFPRNMEYLGVLQKLAMLTGNTELAAKVQQNLDPLKVLRDQMSEQLKIVGANYEDFEGRMKLADMAVECGEGEFAERVYRGLFIFFPDKETIVRERHNQSENRRQFLVDLGEPIPLSENTGAAPVVNPPDSPPPIPKNEFLENNGQKSANTQSPM